MHNHAFAWSKYTTDFLFIYLRLDIVLGTGISPITNGKDIAIQGLAFINGP